MNKVAEINPYLCEKFRMPQRLVSLYKFMYFVFAADLGFVNHDHRRINFILKLYPVIKSIVTITAGLYTGMYLTSNEHTVLCVNQIMVMLRYPVGCIAMFLLRNKVTFKIFLTDILKFEQKIKMPATSFGFEPKILLAYGGLFFISFIHFSNVLLFKMYGTLESLWKILFFFYIPQLNTGVFTVCICLVYYGMYTRLHYIYLQIVNMKNESLLPYLLSYKYVANLMELTNGISSLLFSGLYFFNVPYIMVMLYAAFFLDDSKKHEHHHSYTFFNELVDEKEMRPTFDAITTVVVAFTELFLPCVVAGLVTAEAAKISACLQHKRLKERTTDITRQEDYEVFIQYIKYFPFKFYILDIFPLGWYLPGLTLNFIITYIIVILQVDRLV